MKYFFYIALTIFFLGNFYQTHAIGDYQSDYTLIDCVNGDNATAEVFNSQKPFSSLANGIVSTINAINADSNLKTASKAEFKIKVDCNIIYNYATTIDLNFVGSLYGNTLTIEGGGSSGLIISNVLFRLPTYNGGNIVFKNAKFIDTGLTGAYFTRYSSESKSIAFTRGILIRDSYIKLQEGSQLGQSVVVQKFSVGSNGWAYSWLTQIFVENSLVDIDTGNSPYTFTLPASIKNSKLQFHSQSFPINIIFAKQDTLGGFPFAVFMSNEIDVGGNNIDISNANGGPYLVNNKISNFGTFTTGNGKGYFLNNLFENTSDINISANKNMYNNVFLGSFIDTSDPNNLRKNYTIDNIGTQGVGWIFQKRNSNPLFDINYTSNSLYKEITGQDIPFDTSSIYLLFQ